MKEVAAQRSALIPEVCLQHVGRLHGLAEDGTAADKIDMLLCRLGCLGELVQALDDAFFRTLGHGGVIVVLVLRRQIIEDVFLLLEHASQSVLDDDGDLIGEGRIVGDAVRHGAGDDVAVAVLMTAAPRR